MPVCEEWQALAREFYTDSHKYWPRGEDDAAKCAAAADNQKKWNQIARADPHGGRSGGERSPRTVKTFWRRSLRRKSRRSYRISCRNLPCCMRTAYADPEEFDLSYYTYGLSVYGNLPLIEPLESREVKKIREFVIVIDTSYSTSGELVEQFCARRQTSCTRATVSLRVP